MNKWSYIALGVTVFAGLLWLWPNLVHEPLHWAAAKVQGTDAHINFDWSFPPTPTTTREGDVRGVVGGLLFVLAPSLFSLFILAALLWTRKEPGFLTHVVLGMYLSFDLMMNIIGYQSPTSDFHFLVVLPNSAAAMIGACAAGSIGIALLMIWMKKEGYAHDVHTA